MPLKKGQTNNPHGRPRKNASLTELLAKYGNKKFKVPEKYKELKELNELDGLKLKDALAVCLWQLALYNRDLPAMRYIFDRIDGKPAMTIITNIDRGDMPIIKTAQKELFSEEEMEGIQDEGTLEPPEEAVPSAGE